ncbi:hypothetical protein B0H13DRAFT_2272611 [Mycena leptocephala]|nr:hypothetical protein B0H13DRAFT_2272611 [Mycena leptocephala]
MTEGDDNIKIKRDEFAENPDVDAAGCSGGTEIGSEMKMESTDMCIVPPLYVDDRERICAGRKTTPTRPASLDTGCLIQGTPAANSKHDKSGIDIDEAAPYRIVHAGLVSTIQNAPRRTRQDKDPANEYTLVDVPPRRAEHRRPRPASSKMMPPRGPHPTPHVVRAELGTPTRRSSPSQRLASPRLLRSSRHPQPRVQCICAAGATHALPDLASAPTSETRRMDDVDGECARG